MVSNKSIVAVINGILDELESDKSNLEYGSSWKQQMLKDLKIPVEDKKAFGYWEERD